MADEVKVDKETFHNRLNQLVSTWKSDKRQSSDALFGGVSSIVVLMGKTEEQPVLHKSNAFHARLCRECWRGNALTLQQSWLLGYEFPATLMILTFDCLYVVTTAKKGGPRNSDESYLHWLSADSSQALGSLEGRQDTTRSSGAG